MRSRAPMARNLVAVAFLALLVGGCGSTPSAQVPTSQVSASQTPKTSPPSAQAPPTSVVSCDGRGDPDRVGPPWQDRPGVTEPSTIPAAMDTRHGVIVALEVAAFPGEQSVTWTFDVCTNTWSRKSPSAGPEEAMYRFVYDSAADVTLAIPHWKGPMWAYSVGDDAWTKLPEANGRPSGITDVAYDSDRAQVMAWSDFDGALFQYDFARNEWSRVGPLVYPPGVFAPAPSRRDVDGGTLGYSFLAYDTDAHDLVLTMLAVGEAPGATWLFHSDTWSWTKAEQEPPFLNLGYGEFGTEVAYDAAHGAMVIDAFGYLAERASADGSWSLPDPTVWSPQLTFEPGGIETEADGTRVHFHPTRGPLARSWPTLVYDPVNERVVMVGGTSAIVDWTKPLEGQWMWWILADVWAYDLGTNSWTRLVAPHEPPVMSGHYTE